MSSPKPYRSSGKQVFDELKQTLRLPDRPAIRLNDMTMVTDLIDEEA